jgi:hypothetical protein
MMPRNRPTNATRSNIDERRPHRVRACAVLFGASVGCAASAGHSPAPTGSDASAGAFDSAPSLDVSPHLSAPGGRIEIYAPSPYTRLTRLDALFVPRDSDGAPPCVQWASSSCVVTDCHGLRNRDGTFRPSPHAGRIAVSVADRPHDGRIVEVAIAPGPFGVYSSGYSYLDPVRDGTALHVVAEGGAVPGFTTTVNLPPPLVVFTPASTEQAMIDRTADFRIVWQPTAAPVAAMLDQSIRFTDVLGNVYTGLERVSALCIFDGAAGSGAIPRAVLSAFNATDLSGLDTWLRVRARWETRLMAGEFDVAIGAGNGGSEVSPTVR